jgi:hypothetical protein
MLRRPPQYAPRDIELLLEALWGMFSESQAEQLVVAVPWEEGEALRRMRHIDFAALLESWLE